MSTEYTETSVEHKEEDYWTLESMAAAKPMFVTPATTPKPDAEPPGYDATQSAMEIVFPQTAGEVTNTKATPYRRVGILYLMSGGVKSQASACVIASNTLLTAAHNIYKAPEGYAKNIEFYPAAGQKVGAPFGFWRASSVCILNRWKASQHWSDDVGIIFLESVQRFIDDAPPVKNKIGDVVGCLKRRYNIPVQGSAWLGVGYPKSVGLMKMWREPGNFAGTYTDDGGTVISKTGTMGGGACGGPWLLTDESVNGIQTTLLEQKYVISVYFNDSISDFIESNLR